MGLLKKAACAAAVVMLLCPAPGQAAKASSVKQDKQPVITLGDRPAAEAIRQKQGAQPVTEKTESDSVSKITSKKTAQPAAAKTQKRNLNDVYILPRGYKDITIKGKAQATKKQAARLIAANNKQMGIGCSIGEIVDLYWEEAGREGIRPDMALSQALVETGYFNFGGSVEPWQHNFCGLGTIGSGVQGAAFKTPQEGVRAHIQHLMAYVSHDRPKTKLIDPRYDRAHNLRLEKGLITKWSGLNWTWAMGGEYAEKIINTHQLMLRCEDTEPDGMWKDYKKQQKELEKLYEKKMKEREEAEKKYRNRNKGKTHNEQKPVLKDNEKAGMKK